MDCLHGPNYKVNEPRLLDNGTRSRRNDRLIKAILAILTLLFVVLLAVVIWLGVEYHKARRDINDLKTALLPFSGQVISSASGTSSSTTSAATQAPAIYLSKNATASSGYTYGGSLFRGAGYWATQPPMPSPRAGFAAVNLNETVYFLGGHDGIDTYLASGFTYQPLQNLTGTVPAMPSARSHFAAGTIDNTSIIVAGGYSSGANKARNVPENCSLVYNVSTRGWTTGACLKQGRGAACGAAVAGRLFIVGGIGSGGSALASIEVYTPANNSLATFAQLPSARSEVGCAASGNNLIVAGGTNASGNGDLKEVYAIDANKGNMTRLADMLYPRFGLQLVGVPGGDVIAVGGGQHQKSTEVGLHYTERYSLASNRWVEKAQIGDRRFAFASVYANEGVYAAGGQIFCNETLSEDCVNTVRDSIEVLFDSSHPDVFVHIQQPGADLKGAAPNSSQVLLLSTTAGVNGYTPAGSLYRGSGYWSEGQDLPQALSDLSVVGSGNSIYVIGGLDLDALEVTDTFYEYDPVLDQYTNLSSLPEPRYRGGADIVNGLLYYVGGYATADESGTPVDTMLVYNISADSWSISNATLSTARSDLCVAAVNGSLYAAGGYSANYAETLNIAQKYDPNTKVWSNVTSMPTPRGDVMCAALNGEFVVAGGFYDPSNNFTPASFRTEVQAYNPTTDSWRTLAPLPVARGDAAMAAVPSQFGARLIVVGGESQVDNVRTGIATHQVQEYSSALDEWLLKAPMITPRFRHDVAYAEGHLLSFGGASSSLCDDSGQNCTLRPVATVEEFWDTDNPDIFVYLSSR